MQKKMLLYLILGVAIAFSAGSITYANSSINNKLVDIANTVRDPQVDNNRQVAWAENDSIGTTQRITGFQGEKDFSVNDSESTDKGHSVVSLPGPRSLLLLIFGLIGLIVCGRKKKVVG